MSRIPVYFMPGLAASSAIFERIFLPEKDFEMILLEWEIPLKNETLEDYAKRISKKIRHINPILIGVSFGGILVQEMAEFIDARKVVIISSVKSNLEFPTRMKVAKITKTYKLIPTSLIGNIDSLLLFSFGKKINHKIKLYEKFLCVRDKRYLNWAIEKIVLWDRTVADENVIHIHGNEDDVFPIENIQNCIVLKGGTHAMIIVKYKWFNENLPLLLS